MEAMCSCIRPRVEAKLGETGGAALRRAASDRLAQTNEVIVQIALSCGYSDQSAFSRQFKQAVGISPLAYWKKMQGD
jgi:AraC-like DNA-binding protein